MRIPFGIPCVLLVLACGTGARFNESSSDEKPPSSAPAPGIRPRFKETTLVLGKDSIKVSRVVDSWYPEYQVNRRSISLRGASLHAEETGTGMPAWTAKATDGRKLTWLAAERDIAYLIASPPEDGEKKPRDESPATIRRLDLTAGRWLPPLTLPRSWRLDSKTANAFFRSPAFLSATPFGGSRLTISRNESIPNRLM
jgi:hypothetical protein